MTSIVARAAADDRQRDGFGRGRGSHGFAFAIEPLVEHLRARR